MPSPSAIAWARQSGVRLAANHLLDQPANPVTNPGLDGIKPIVKKVGVTLGHRMRKLRMGVLHRPCHAVEDDDLVALSIFRFTPSCPSRCSRAERPTIWIPYG